jgi:hypothetical protein
VHYTIIESDEAGGSRFRDVSPPAEPTTAGAGGYPLLSSDPVAACAVVFADVPAGLTRIEAHGPPQPQFVVVLSGTLRVEVTGAESRSFAPGSVVLAADVVGAGHVTRFSDGPCRLLLIPLDFPPGRRDTSLEVNRG